MKNIYKITNLEEFSTVLNGEVTDSQNVQNQSPIYYVHYDETNHKYFIYDSSIPTYHKVLELASIRFLQSMKLLEAISNNYIPIFDKNTKKILFTEEEFFEIRKKLSGLKEYNGGDFIFSDNLHFPGIENYLELIDSNFAEINFQKNVTNKEISKILSSIGISIKNDESEDSVELIDTGSTARGTNIPSLDEETKWDFDFLMKVDEEKIDLVRNTLLRELDSSPDKIVTKYRIRLKDVKIAGLPKPLDIDISFVPKKEKYFSTEQALYERLEHIKNQDEEKYRLILANIMHAKKILKESKAYKPSRSDKTQGGIGGVGIENWILQNGGSLIDSAVSFVESAQGKDFISFEKEYPIYDFGKNHISVAKHAFPYDNFIMKNMRENGFLKMQKCLTEFLLTLEKEENNSLKH